MRPASGRFAHMFDRLVDAATGSRAPAAGGPELRTPRVPSAAPPRHSRLRTADGSAERELWFDIAVPKSTLRRGDGEQLPFAGHALEFVSAAVLELEP